MIAEVWANDVYKGLVRLAVFGRGVLFISRIAMELGGIIGIATALQLKEKSVKQNGRDFFENSHFNLFC